MSTTRSRGPGPLRRSAAGHALLLATTFLLGPVLLLVSPSAAAAPPLTIPDAKAQIEQLQTDAEAFDQSYLEVEEQLKQGRGKLKGKRADARAQAGKVAGLRREVGQAALAQFQNRDLDTAARLVVSEDTTGFLRQVSTIGKINENQNSALQDLQQQQASLASLEQSAEIDLAKLKEQEQELQKLRKASDKKISEAKAVLAKLTAKQRRQIADEEAKAAAEARRDAEQGNREASGLGDSDNSKDPSDSDDSDSDDSDAEDDDATSSASGRGAVALAYARKQLGKPYRWGAAGPEAYDCSGLTLAAWRAAGVSLPRVSRAQAGVGREVAKSDLQPGDLVFFYSPISHVSLYAGNGTILDAPRPGKTVRYLKMSYMPFTTARRPG